MYNYRNYLIPCHATMPCRQIHAVPPCHATMPPDPCRATMPGPMPCRHACHPATSRHATQPAQPPCHPASCPMPPCATRGGSASCVSCACKIQTLSSPQAGELAVTSLAPTPPPGAAKLKSLNLYSKLSADFVSRRLTIAYQLIYFARPRSQHLEPTCWLGCLEGRSS